VLVHLITGNKGWAFCSVGNLGDNLDISGYHRKLAGKASPTGSLSFGAIQLVHSLVFSCASWRKLSQSAPVSRIF